MSDTPRTDAAAALVQYAVVGEQYEVVTAAFAQELERELTHALSEQERMRVGWVATQKELFEARLAAPVPEGRLTAEEIALIGDAIWSTNNDDPDKPRAQVILNGLSMNDGEGKK